MRARLQNELFDLKDLFELSTGETVRIQAHFGNLALSHVESLIDSESRAEYNLGPRVFSDEAADEDPGKIHFIAPKFWGKNACAVRLNVCF